MIVVVWVSHKVASVRKNVTCAHIGRGLKPRSVTGEILKADKINAYNEFGKAPAVAPVAFTGAKASGKGIKLTLPAASVVVLEIQ